MRSPLSVAVVLLLISSCVQGQDKPKNVEIAKAAFKTINLKGAPDFLAADGDDVWVLNIGKIEKLSAKSMKVILSVPVPHACGAMVVGFNSVWVASCRKDSVYRIDKQTGKLLSIIPCGISDEHGEISLAIGDGSVWILSDSSGILTRINPKSNSIQAKMPVMTNSYCAAYGFNSVWITNTNNNSVQRIDPKTNAVIATINVGNTPRFLAVGENGVWTLNQKDGTVSRIDPKLNKEVAVINTGVPGVGGDIATGGGFVWVRAIDRLLQKIDPASNTIDAIYSPAAGSGAVRVSDHYIWVTAHDIETIWVLETEVRGKS